MAWCRSGVWRFGPGLAVNVFWAAPQGRPYTLRVLGPSGCGARSGPGGRKDYPTRPPLAGG